MTLNQLLFAVLEIVVYFHVNSFIDSSNNAWFLLLISIEKQFIKFFHYLEFSDVNPFFYFF